MQALIDEPRKYECEGHLGNDWWYKVTANSEFELVAKVDAVLDAGDKLVEYMNAMTELPSGTISVPIMGTTRHPHNKLNLPMWRLVVDLWKKERICKH